MSFGLCLLILGLVHSSLSDLGFCPPPLPVSVCEPSCSQGACEGSKICCPTDCGGFKCVEPVTKRKEEQVEKPGSCPEKPTGRWVCSSTCTDDSDCPRSLKCCPNRCKAKTCSLPYFDYPNY